MLIFSEGATAGSDENGKIIRFCDIPVITLNIKSGTAV